MHRPFATRLGALMALGRVTLADVAETTGVTTSAVSLWRSGLRFPKRKYAAQLEDLFGASIDELLLPMEDTANER